MISENVNPTIEDVLCILMVFVRDIVLHAWKRLLHTLLNFVSYAYLAFNLFRLITPIRVNCLDL